MTAGGATPLIAINLDTALLGISQNNGEEWDSSARVADRLLMAMRAILSASGNPIAAVASQLLSFLGGADFAHYNKPDSAGTADIFANGSWMLRGSFIGDEDSFTPQWRRFPDTSMGTPSTGWNNVPLTPTLQFRVTLRDRDLLDADDPMGTFTITYADICRALEPPGGVTYVRVAEMALNQTLLFGFSAVRQ